MKYFNRAEFFVTMIMYSYYYNYTKNTVICYNSDNVTKLNNSFIKFLLTQRAKKVVSDSPGLVNSVFNLPDGQVMFFEEFE